MRLNLVNVIVCGLALILWAGCGVKGDPIPPDTPAELGRGQPTYRKAIKKMKWSNTYMSDKGKDWEEEKDTNEEESDWRE